MNRGTFFGKNYRVHFTPLSPIHIGDGSDFEPINFVVDKEEGCLYGFNPVRVLLSQQEKADLGKLAWSRNAFSEIQRFYAKRLEKYKCASQAVVPIDKAAMENLDKLIEGRSKVNENKIPKTASVLLKGDRRPYIPGSSLKGLIRTAMFDGLVERGGGSGLKEARSIQKMDEIAYGGGMEKSPLRYLKPGDLMPSETAYTRIIKANRIHKNDEPLPQAQGIPSWFEIVEKAQFRAFSGGLALEDPREIGAVVPQPMQDVESLVKCLNRYYGRLFDDESRIWESGNRATLAWYSGVRRLLMQLKPEMDAGKVALIRIGHNSGAEALTIRKCAQIWIRKRTGGHFSQTTSTFFSAIEEMPGGDKCVLPFGWAILEVGDQERSALESWCQKAHSQDMYSGFDTQGIKKALKVQYEQELKDLEEARVKALAEKAATEKAEAEARRKKAEIQAKFADLPENQRIIMEFCEEVVEDPKGMVSGSELERRKNELFVQLKKSPSDFLIFAKELGKLQKRRNERWGKK